MPAPLGAGLGLAVGFALLGAFFVATAGDGDGDGRAAPAPLVWMPGGMGRLAFPAGMAGGAAVATGPIASVGEGFARAGGRGGRSTLCFGSRGSHGDLAGGRGESWGLGGMFGRFEAGGLRRGAGRVSGG